ncbi:hypothetical protein FQR65_LT19646 [Abscondita terminalis]|nr:hypothetical protein FQR65_LT19646 [Abscondita terminalis]
MQDDNLRRAAKVWKTGVPDSNLQQPTLKRPFSDLRREVQSPSVFISGKIYTVPMWAGTEERIKDNNLQVVGVAPKSKLDFSKPLHLGLARGHLQSQLAGVINWAVANGADVINNSWGDQGGIFYAQLYSLALENAIVNAMTNGEEEKEPLWFLQQETMEVAGR